MREINEKGFELVQRFEGIEDGDPKTRNLDPYLDPVGVVTIGWGHAIVDPRTRRLLRGHAALTRAKELYPIGLTDDQAVALLRADLLDASRDVTEFVKVPLNENEFAALVSFEFNTGALVASTLLKKLNANDRIGAANEFHRWTKGHLPDGTLVKLDGLVWRREEERTMFLLKEETRGA